MPVTFDATANANNGTTAQQTLTWSHTVGSGTDRILLVGVSGSNPTSPTTTDNISSIKYGGVAFTKITFLAETPSSTGRYVDLWYLLNPTSGTASIVVTNISTGSVMSGGSISFSGMSQTTPLGTAVTNGGTSVNSLSATTTGSTANDVVVAVMAARDSVPVTIGGSQASQWAIINNTNIAGTATTQTGGASVTSTFSWTTADNGAMIAVPVLNDSGTVNTGQFFAVL